MSKPLVLSAFKKDDIVIFDLAETTPIGRYEQFYLDSNLSKQIIQEIKKIAHLSNIAQTSALDTTASYTYSDEKNPSKELEKLGRMVFDQLLPAEVKNALRTSEAEDLVLRLDEPLLEIPWELAHDGKTFIGNRFHVGRQVISKRSLDTLSRVASQAKEQDTHVLIISDPTGTLPEVEKETEILVDLLDRQDGFHVEVIGGERASKFYILRILAEFDIVHFAGHSVFIPENPRENGWRLHDGFLGPEELRRITNPPRLVFSNSCSSAAVKDPGEDCSDDTGTPKARASPVQIGSLGLGGSFLMAGVQNYVGALWVIHDSSSAYFAKSFYVDLVAGSSIGEALWNAKRESIISQPVQTFIWASYVHYGNPQDRPVFSKMEKQKGTKKCSTDVHQIGARPRFSRPKALFAALLIILLLAAGYWIWITLVSQAKTMGKEKVLLLGLYDQAVSDYKTGRIKQALSALEHLISRRDNPQGIGLAYLSEIYSEAGLDQQADEALEKAVKRNPRGAMGHILLGDRYWRDGDVEKAVKEYLYALEDPSHLKWQGARALNSLGVVDFLTGDIDKAKELFQRVLIKEGGNTDALFNLGVAEYYTGNKKRATAFFRKVLEQDPNDEMALEFLRLVSQAGPLVSKIGPDLSETIACGPLVFSYGSPKRIGLDILICRSLAGMVGNSSADWNYRITPAIYGPNYLNFRMSKLSGQTQIMDLVRSIGCKIAVFGEIGMTQHVITMRLKMVDTESGKLYLNENFRSEGNKNATKIIREVKSVLKKSMSNLKGG